MGVDSVAVQIGAAASPRSDHAVGKHGDQFVELVPGHRGERRRFLDEFVERVLAPVFCRTGRDDLLGENIEGRDRGQDRVEVTRADPVKQPGALDQFISGQGVDASLRRAAAGVPGATDPLQEGSDGPGRTDLTHEIHRSDVDPQLEGRRGDQHLQISRAQPVFDAQTSVLRQAPVMGRHAVRREPIDQQMCQPFGQPSRVDEDQGRGVLLDEFCDAVEHLSHLLCRRHGFEVALG